MVIVIYEGIIITSESLPDLYQGYVCLGRLIRMVKFIYEGIIITSVSPKKQGYIYSDWLIINIVSKGVNITSESHPDLYQGYVCSG